jgi:hypothetical protein
MTGQVGPRGLTVLVIVGLVGLYLALLGWTQRDSVNGMAVPHSVRTAVYLVSGGTAR